jgi:hypothetical protein
VKEWEEKEQVLGHRVRAEVNRPRELLSMPNLSEIDFDLNDDGMEFKAPFTSRLWATRLAVQRGYEALYTVQVRILIGILIVVLIGVSPFLSFPFLLFSFQELQYLLTSPLILASSIAVEEIKREIDSAVIVLSQSLGIRTFESEFLGLKTGLSVQLDGRHIAAILQTNMGKKLLTRGLKLLNQQYRWTLIPVVLARILMIIPPSTTAAPSVPSSSSSSISFPSQPVPSSVTEGIEIEKKLLKTIIDYLQFTYKQYNEIKNSGSSSSTSLATYEIGKSTFSNDLLNNLKQCLKNIMITQMEKNNLRESLLAERTRAEIMHIIVTLGDTITSDVDSQVIEEWKQTRDAFMSFLDN